MTKNDVRFIDTCGARSKDLNLWPAVIITKEEIESEAERLASLDRPDNGRRQSIIAHPRAEAPGLGLAPGIRVTLEVLLPGERTERIRHNSTQVNFCINGSGHTIVQGKRFDFEQYDVINFPSWHTYHHVNDTHRPQVRLTYSNAALLETLNVHVIEEDPPPVEAVEEIEQALEDSKTQSPYGTFQVGNDGAWLMPYETIVNPPTIESKPLHWSWQEHLKIHLDKLAALGKDYVGRRVYLCYNPRTAGTNGTTPNFFATICIRPAGIVDRPHRHISAAINYYFAGKGRSTVEGKIYEWKAGDLMLSAPGWGVHNHASYDEPVYELTIQDQPLHIAMESLLWQENLKKPLAVLGVEEGFDTNRNSATGR